MPGDKPIVTIHQPALLIVEGKDEELFFGALIAYIRITFAEIRNFVRMIATGRVAPPP